MIIETQSNVTVQCQCGNKLAFKLRFRKPGKKILSSYQYLGDEIVIIPYHCDKCFCDECKKKIMESRKVKENP